MWDIRNQIYEDKVPVKHSQLMLSHFKCSPQDFEFSSDNHLNMEILDHIKAVNYTFVPKESHVVTCGVKDTQLYKHQ